MTAGVNAGVGAGAVAATGLGWVIGVADPLHPTNARRIRYPSMSKAGRLEAVSALVDFGRLI